MSPDRFLELAKDRTRRERQTRPQAIVEEDCVARQVFGPVEQEHREQPVVGLRGDRTGICRGHQRIEAEQRRGAMLKEQVHLLHRVARVAGAPPTDS